MGKAVCRIGDKDLVHCSVPSRAGGSSNVFVNGIGVSRQGDVNTTHLLPPNIPPCCCCAGALFCCAGRLAGIFLDLGGVLVAVGAFFLDPNRPPPPPRSAAAVTIEFAIACCNCRSDI